MARNNRVRRDSEENYHVMSRCNNKEFLFGKSGIKGLMVHLLKRAADFSGIKLYAYSVLDNHFHIVLRELHPDWAPTDLSDDASLYLTKRGDAPHQVQYVRCKDPNFTRDMLIRKVLGRVSILKGVDFAEDLREHWAYLDSIHAAAAVDDELKQWLRRMHNVSKFTKTFKELVNITYKRRNKHAGSIFSGRFASTLIEDGEYLATCIRYVELNAVRAGIVKHARDYYYSSHSGESVNEIKVMLGCVPTLPTLDVVMEGNVENRLMRRVVQIGAGVIFGSKGFVTKIIGEQGNASGFLLVRAKIVIGNGYSSHGHKLAWEEDKGLAA